MKFAPIVMAAAFLTFGIASAQTAAPPASTTSVTSAANCPKPDAHPGRLSSENARRGWGKEVVAWQTCMKKYVSEIQTQADEAVKVANAAVARSNAAVNEYNDMVKDLQAQENASVR